MDRRPPWRVLALWPPGGGGVVVCWRVGAMVGARRGAVAAAGRQHVPPSTAGYRRVGRGFDPPARAHTNPRNNRPRCAWFPSPSFVAAVSPPRLLPLPSPFFSPSFAAVVSSACFFPLPPSSPLPAAPCSSPPFVAAASCLLPPLQALFLPLILIAACHFFV